MTATKTPKILLAALLAMTGTAIVAAEPGADAFKAKDWKDVYPNEYYSSLGSADDLHDPSFGYGHGSMAKYMLRSIKSANEKGVGQNATCFSCKTARFNDIHKVYGDEAFSGKKSPKFSGMLAADDFWSCETCHSDMKNPGTSVGARIITASLFGKELFDQFPPKVAACAQCHNNLSVWSDSRIVPATDLLKTGRTAYRYGWDPDGLIKATLEDAVPEGVRYPSAKTYEMAPSSYAKTDKDLDIYLIANGSHADAEFFMGSIHYKLGMGCADCHMPVTEDRNGNPYRSHDASKTPLNSRASMQYCLSCHKSEKVKNIPDMVRFVEAAQSRAAELDKAVADKLDETFVMLKDAITAKKLSEDTLAKARFGYARASYFKEYVYGNRGATPGGKVAHNPELMKKYLEDALRIIDETQALLK